MCKNELINKRVKIINAGTAPFETENQIGIIVGIDERVTPPIAVKFNREINGYNIWNYYESDLKILGNENFCPACGRKLGDEE